MSSKIKLNLFRIFLCGIAIMLIFNMGRILFGENGLYELRRMRLELTELKEKNNRLEIENNALFRTIDRLKNDPAYIEHVARQELQMIATDEIVFKFQDSKTVSGPVRSAGESTGAPESPEPVDLEPEAAVGIVEETLTE